jgi:2-haloacid dehalogenase
MIKTDIAACVFDVYGTLLDFNAAVAVHRERIGPKADALSALWRQKQLEYTWLRALMDRHTDFWEVTGDALDHALAAMEIDDTALRDELLALYRRLAPYPEVIDTLSAIRATGMPTAVLSNGEPSMLTDGLEAAGIAPLVDNVWSVETVGVFKPHPSVYRLATDGLSLPAGRIAFMSANGWDIAGAAAFGLNAIWINRAGATPERLPAGPAAVLPSLAGLPELIGIV